MKTGITDAPKNLFQAHTDAQAGVSRHICLNRCGMDMWPSSRRISAVDLACSKCARNPRAGVNEKNVGRVLAKLSR